jgi:hypothetical protein
MKPELHSSHTRQGHIQKGELQANLNGHQCKIPPKNNAKVNKTPYQKDHSP